jgi:rhomboid protease GluP
MNQTPTLPSEPLPEKPAPPQPIPVVWKLLAKVPTVTYILLGSTIFVFLLQYLTQTLYGTISGLDPVAYWGAKINDLIKAGQYWRLVTPIWLHASIMHILFNMYALFVIGRGLEMQYGHERFLELYLLSGIAGNIASFMLSTKASLGASTAIFGLIAAQTVFVYQNRALYGKRAPNMLLNNVMIIIINLILGLSPGIDNMGHLGGLVGGLAFAWFAGPLWKLDKFSQPFELKDTRPLQRTRFVSITMLLVLIALAIIAIIR